MAHSSKNISLAEYLLEVHKKNILIPEFQRPFIWKVGQKLKLASSLLKSYPIGSFLLMQDSKDYSYRPIEGTNEEIVEDISSQRLLVLDGQQRTTTAYQIFYGTGEHRFYFNYKKFVEDVQGANLDSFNTIIEDEMENWLIAINANKAISRHSEQISKGYFPLDSIFHGKYVKWLDDYSYDNSFKGKDIDKNSLDRLNNCKSIFTTKIIQSVTSYQASEIIIDKDTPVNVVCTIFETINSTGQKLTIIDLLNAKCYSGDFKLRNEFKSAFESDDIFVGFFDDEEKETSEILEISIIKTIGLLTKKSCKKSDLLDLKSDDIKRKWNDTIEYLKNALRYIKQEYGILGHKYFPYNDLLPVITMIINNDKFNKSLEDNKKKLNKWYWTAVFSGFYDNATESKTNKVIKEFLGTEKEKGWLDDDTLIPELLANYNVSDFNDIDSLSTIQSARYKAILNLLALNNISDFGKDRVKILDMKESQLNDHHIYPKHLLNIYSIKGVESNTILNRTLISAETNLKIKDDSPFIYINDPNIVETPLTTEELLKHCIIKDTLTNNFSKEAYNNFKSERKKRIIELIKTSLQV